MPSQRQKHPPTPWQTAKPLIQAALGSALLRRGFATPGMTMWRRRGEFLDVVQLRSKYGLGCHGYFGCHPADLGEPPGESSCIFRTSLAGEFRVPADVALVSSFIERELLPQVLHVVDTWFPRFASLEAAVFCLENHTDEVSISNKHSPAYDDALVALHACLRRRSKR